MTITEATEEITQATEKLFIQNMPVTYLPTGSENPLNDSKQATYNEPVNYTYDRHSITLLVDGTSLIVKSSDITPNRPLTDEEMVANLTEQMYEMSLQIEQFRTTVVLLEEDVEKISTALLQEAENRGWCEEYNNFCEEVNSTLRRAALQPQESEYEVEIRVTATISTDTTVTVTARSLDEARDMIGDSPESYFDPSAEAFDSAKDGWDDYDIEFI